MTDDDLDTPMRMEAFEHVRRLGEVHDHLTADELKPGFVFEGARIPLVNPRRGIFKPRQMRYLLSAVVPNRSCRVAPNPPQPQNRSGERLERSSPTPDGVGLICVGDSLTSNLAPSIPSCPTHAVGIPRPQCLVAPLAGRTPLSCSACLFCRARRLPSDPTRTVPPTGCPSLSVLLDRACHRVHLRHRQRVREVLIDYHQRRQHRQIDVCPPTGPAHPGLEQIDVPANACLPDSRRLPIERMTLASWSRVYGPMPPQVVL